LIIICFMKAEGKEGGYDKDDHDEGDDKEGEK
jgi:hypothetical protein